MAEKMRDISEDEGEGIQVSSRLVMCLMIGFAVVIIGIILVMAASLLGGGSASVGGIVFIGPFPLVVGVGPDAVWLISISVAISVVMVLAFWLIRRRNYG